MSRCAATLLVAAIVLMFALPASAQTEQVLYNFDGSNAQAGVTMDAAGNLYGTQALNVFQLTPQADGGWSESVIYTFGEFEDTEGAVVFDQAGNLYATNLGPLKTSLGFVFELSPGAGGSWTEQTLYNFPPTGVHGHSPYGDLIFDSAGNIYGTTFYGGAYGGVNYTDGAAFELIPQAGGGWTEKLLHSFGSNTDGQEPFAGMIFDKAGNLYGTTFLGGANNLGTVFELIPQGEGIWKEKILHTFGHGTDGQQPKAKLAFDSAGNLYSTTTGGGLYGQGTVFELLPQSDGTWKEAVLHNFGNGTDGSAPYSDVILDASNNLYGTTFFGGQYGGGVLFKLTPGPDGSWAETIVHSFGNGTDGAGCLGDIIFDTAGNIYGTTLEGGTLQEGTVWEVTP
jgi:uncharacterized repeat protein (TIGR03803 family)